MTFSIFYHNLNFVPYRSWQPQKQLIRLYSDKKTPKKRMPPMDTPIPGLPKPIYSSLKEEHQNTQVTTLSNGLRVASENRFGEFCTVGGKVGK